MAALRPDPFTLALIATVVVASFLPARGPAADALDQGVRVAVMLLFFLHGARLAREAVVQALAHWRLHLLVLAITFVLFPLLGWASAPFTMRVLDASLVHGLLFLCCLPSTVQSSIAFTSMALGNVPAAAVTASASNLLGVFITPLLASVLLARQGSAAAGAIGSIATLLLLPFVAGQFMRPWIGAWIRRQRTLLALIDRGAILLMVYATFSKAVIDGIWSRLSATDLTLVFLACGALLGLIVLLAVVAARRLGFPRPDEATILFCGSTKSLVTGVPMANVLFPGAQAGVIILPVMIFHQLQLLACAILARRYAQASAQAEARAPAVND